MGPSSTRTTDANVMVSGLRASKYPPPRPLRLRKKPCCLSSAKMVSKNFLGMSSRSAMSAISMGSPGGADASCDSAFKAYLVFMVIKRREV